MAVLDIHGLVDHSAATEYYPYHPHWDDTSNPQPWSSQFLFYPGVAELVHDKLKLCQFYWAASEDRTLALRQALQHHLPRLLSNFEQARLYFGFRVATDKITGHVRSVYAIISIRWWASASCLDGPYP
jgi:hypothetical protein